MKTAQSRPTLPQFLAKHNPEELMKKIANVTKSGQIHASFTVACSIEDITLEVIKKLDDRLKTAIAATTRVLEKSDIKNLNWEKVLSIMSNNPTLEPFEAPIFRSDTLIKDSSCWFNDGKADKTIVQEVTAWFKNLIQDKDILRYSKIELDIVAQIVAATGIAIQNIFNHFFGTDYREKTLIDIGFIRYPDIDNPYFKVYRISLTAWADLKKTFGLNTNKTGIRGELNVQKFRERKTVIDKMQPDIVKQGAKEAEALFADG